MRLYKRKRHFRSPRERMARSIETFLKCFILFLKPAAFSAFVSLGWYFLFYNPNRNFGDGMQEIIAEALLPALGIIYGIMVAGIAVDTVWKEYKDMRTATKRYDFDTFMDLRDEELSPLIHVIVSFVSLGMLSGFLALKYPSARAGIIVIAGVAFFLALMYVVVREIDDPCAGLWYIKGIPDEWLDFDPKEYRKDRCEKLRQEFLKKKNGGKCPAEPSPHS
jgi:hypothetical protein